MGSLDMSQNQNGISIRFLSQNSKTQAKIFLLNRPPEDAGGGGGVREPEGAAGGRHDADDEGRVQWGEGYQPRGGRLSDQLAG